jgi:hypothetical protein
MEAKAQMIVVKVRAEKHDYAEVPVSVVVKESALDVKKAQGTTVACQAEALGNGEVRLTWWVRDLKKGEERTYTLKPETAEAGQGVTVTEAGGNAEVRFGEQPITHYDTTTGPNKPYFYPLMAPTGKPLTRHYPLEKVEGETADHPHHRGLWFTHGEMNGTDFWSEGAKAGKSVHTGYEVVSGGVVYGLVRAKTDWLTGEGKKIADDVRDVRFYPSREGYLLDFAITVRAVGGPLVWGDTKEGTFALRVADSLRADAGKDKPAFGHIINAEGLEQGATWGKASPWVDYYGPVDGQIVGVAIFDSPTNPRHPTTWHVRTYGLFAVNPFGLHDFDPALKEQPHIGDMTTLEGEAVTFRYRLYIHKGTTTEAKVAEMWNAFAHPPTVDVVR